MFILLILCLGHCLPGASSQGIDCHVGDTVTLPCDGPAATDTKEVDVLWVFGGRPACSYENGRWCEAGHYVNRTRLGSIRQNNFSLVINHVKEEDDGAYVCRIYGEDIRSIRLIVDEPAGDQKQRDAVMPPGDPVCRPYREGADPPESKTKDKQDSYENPPESCWLSDMEKRYEGKWSPSMLAEFCWTLKRDAPEAKCSRKSHTYTWASSGGNSVVIVGIVGIVGILVAAVGAAVFIKRQWNRQGDENLPDPGPSEHPLINALTRVVPRLVPIASSIGSGRLATQ